MMKILVMIDSFKGSLSSQAAGEACLAGALRACPSAEGRVLPLADGGEGTVSALVAGCGGRLAVARVRGPLGEPVDARYGIINGDTAVIEMAEAAGLTLVLPSRRNPLHTTTYGVGELILDAMANGCRKFILGIGGSATNDGGLGMLRALGFGFYDAAGQEVSEGALGLSRLDTITREGAHPALSECRFSVACDVTNPLCGSLGCSAVFAPQKGATPDMVRDMDAWLAAYAQKAAALFPSANPDLAGAGAAGGLGFALATFLGATLSPGTPLVLDALRAEEYVKQADVIVTGEGRLDGQSAMGKAPIGVARLAKRYGKTVVALVGCIGDGAGACHTEGVDAFFPILQGVCTLDEAMQPETAKKNLAATAEQVFRLVSALIK